MINGIIIVALIVVAIFAVKGSIRQFTYGCCGTKDVEKKIKVQDKNASDYPYYAVIGVDGSLQGRNTLFRNERDAGCGRRKTSLMSSRDLGSVLQSREWSSLM